MGMSAAWAFEVAMRWAHIFAAITALGGAFFMWAVLIPAAQSALQPEEHRRLREAVVRRWRMVVHTCILLFLISGFYNYFVITRLTHAGQTIYHALFFVKVLLAFATFAVALLVTSSRAIGERMRQRNHFWVGAIVLLASAIVLISGVIRVMY